MFATNRFTLLLCGTSLLIGAGCGHSKDSPQAEVAKASAKVVAHEGHTHDGWWCDEHGVPEEVCGLCDSKLAAEFQKKGDWCKQHDRPDSQCFVCHPELADKFAAQYIAKYGKQPPKID